jgi:hypothetical protein
MAAPEALSPVVYADTADYLLASYGPLFMVEWRAATPMVGCVGLRRECENLGKRFPTGVGLLTVIQAHSPPPGAAERVAIAEFMRAGHYIKTSAVVVDGNGFRSAFVRGVVTGLTLLARQPFPHRVLTLTEAAACFSQALSPGWGVSVTPERLLREIGRLRANGS